jgi:2-(1,2-epoxy-1,2-dihydrophenyl)acetyl-CoA isomerase
MAYAGGMSDTVIYAAANGIVTLTLNRPEKLNAVNAVMLARLCYGLDLAERDDSVRAVVITGAGRAFSSGQDLTERLPLGDDGRPDLESPLERAYNPLALRLIEFPKITIGALNGPAVGATANLALACDILVAARSAYFQLPFARIGLIPDAGGTWLLPRIVGAKYALALALTGDKVTADDARAMGLVYKVFDDQSFAANVQAFAATFAHGAATAYRLIKEAFRKSQENGFAAQLTLEAGLQGEAGRTDDFHEAIAAFAEKRPPAFAGR